MTLRAALASLLILAGCFTASEPDTPTRAQIADSTLPPMQSFQTSHPTPPIRSNANIAADFLSLHFELESGRALPILTRFETRITVRVMPPAPPSLQPDLQHLLARLRNEAGIDIRQIQSGPASITIHPVPGEDLRKALPQAACFVAPNVDDLADYRRNRRSDRTNWSLLRVRTKMAIFLPSDAAPQEIRDCLHEELAQALGPLNDLYRLPDSIFNDDNVHTVLTGFDMLILRATYAPELSSGMSKAEVAAELPGILSQMNPRGDTLPARAISPSPRVWIDDVQTALGPGSAALARRDAASAAVDTAVSLGWHDHRSAFSYYMLGRMTQENNPDQAQQDYRMALAYLSRLPGTELHRAHIVTQTAAYEISQGHGATALKQIAPYIDVARRAENAALLATLMLLQAEALDEIGQTETAAGVRLDSLGWARYGFGADWAVRAKMQEIAALNPNRTGDGG